MSDNILEQINNIAFEDLCLIENDLHFSDKVSIAFLLFADQKTNAKYILENLEPMLKNKNTTTDILIKYSTVNKNWKPFIVEALFIIKAKKCLRKLNVPYSVIRTQMRLRINPVLRALYSMCEMMTPIEAGNLVLDIRDNTCARIAKDRSFYDRFYDFDYLEMFILYWITEQILDVSSGKSTNIQILLDYCKRKNMETIKYVLDYSLMDFNLTTDRHMKESSEEELKCCENNNNLSLIDRIPVQPPKIPLFSSKSGNRYKINKERAGYVLIINQIEFHESKNPELKSLLPKKALKCRTGTDVDKTSLRNTFSSFGYTPIIKDNLNHIDMRSNIREVVKRSDMYDSLIVCILSHGIEGSVYGCDSIPVHIDDIKQILTDQSILKKPKMLIIQACQGGILQQARRIDSLEHDTIENSSADYADMIIAMSTIPGFASLRHVENGSWFIQTLCEQINKLGDSDHMSEILIAVNAVVADKRGINDICMTSISSQTLRKKFYLPSRLSC